VKAAELSLGVLLLRYALDSERAEGRLLIADFPGVLLPGAVVPRLRRVHALELQNDDAVWWWRAIECHGLIEATRNIPSAALFDYCFFLPRCARERRGARSPVEL
jgi:hypothetical protein